nr:MAG TPA: hypothetical protein [Caudoviricetes sp.]
MQNFRMQLIEMKLRKLSIRLLIEHHSLQIVKIFDIIVVEMGNCLYHFFFIIWTNLINLLSVKDKIK